MTILCMQKIYTSIPVDIKKIIGAWAAHQDPPHGLLGFCSLMEKESWQRRAIGRARWILGITSSTLSSRYGGIIRPSFVGYGSIISPLSRVKKWARRKSRPSARYLTYLESPVVIPYTDFFFSRCCWWEVRSLAISRLSVGYMYVSCTALDMEGHPHVNLSQGLPCQKDRKGP